MTAMSTTAATGQDGPGAATDARPVRRLTADARRRQLFDVALSLFAEHGYSATTMDDIAEAAGVTKPLVYQHFESKRALYLELLDVVSHGLIDRIVQSTAAAEGPRQQVEFGFAGYFELMVDNENAFRLLYGRDAPDDPELGAALRALVADAAIRKGVGAANRRRLRQDYQAKDMIAAYEALFRRSAGTGNRGLKTSA